MKKILNGATSILKNGLAIKELVSTVLHPLQFLRNSLKTLLVSTLVFIIKEGIKRWMGDNTSPNRAINQLKALTDSNTDMNGLEHNLTFKLTLDDLVKKSELTEEYKLLYIDFTKAVNKISTFKNSLRDDIYQYVVEEDFKNIQFLASAVNEVLSTPTQIVGCRFAECSITVLSHDLEKQDFEFELNVNFALKST